MLFNENLSESLEQEYDQYIQNSIDIRNFLSDLLTSDIELEHSDIFKKLETKNNLNIFNILTSLNNISWCFPSRLSRVEKIFELILPLIIQKKAISNEQLKYEIFTSKLLLKRVESILSPFNNINDHFINQKNSNNRINNKKLFEIILNDDFVAFQDIISQNDIDIDGNMVIPSDFEHKTFFKSYFGKFGEEKINYEIEDDHNSNNDHRYLNDLIYKGKFIEIAAFFGSIKIFKFLWMNKVEIDNCIAKYAIAGGNYEIIHLIEEYVSYSPEDLYFAIQYYRNDIYDYIINNNDFEFNKNEIRTAVRSNNLEFLVSNISNIKETISSENDMIQLLSKSIQNKNAMIFVFLFIQYFRYLNGSKEFDLSSLLKEAISEKSYEIVKFLINVQNKIGNDYKFVSNLQGSDLIKGTGEIMEYLMPYIGKDIVFDMDLMCKASSNSVVEVVEFIDNKCDLFKNVKFSNETPFHCACLTGNLNVIKYLASVHKEWIEIKDNDGVSPIHDAVMSSKLEVVKYLIQDMNVDINVVDNENRTPLYFAVDEGYKNIVEFLCSLKEIDINIKTINGATPLELAINKKSDYIVDVLKTKGGKQNIFSNI